MTRGDRDRAIAFALSTHPDRIGVGRLCQELLAEVTGMPVTLESCTLVRLDIRGAKPGQPRAPWTPERRERQMAAIQKRRNGAL